MSPISYFSMLGSPLNFYSIALGTSELNYYYVNNIYKWEVIDFTTIGAIANALTILIAVPNMWFFNDILKMSDPEMVAACFFCYSLKYGLLSVAKLSIYFYYAREFLFHQQSIRLLSWRLLGEPTHSC